MQAQNDRQVCQNNQYNNFFVDEFFKKEIIIVIIILFLKFQFSAWTLEVSVSKFLLFIVVVVWIFEFLKNCWF